MIKFLWKKLVPYKIETFVRCFTACIRTVLSYKEAEEWQDYMLDCNYLKVDIDAMVADLDNDDSNT